MRNRLFRYLLFLLGIAAAIAALFLFLSNRPLSVEVARPADNVQIQVFGLGTVEARILSNIGFEVGAALVKLNADHGDRVNQGDVLARLHNAEQEARVAKAKAGMVNAAAAVKTAEAAVGKSRAVLAQRKQTNQRKQMLVARRTVSVESAEEAQMEQDVAAAELAVAISGVDVAKAVLEDATAQVVPETVWVLAYVDEARAGEIRVGQPAEVRLRSLSRQMYAGYVIRIGLESDRVSEERRVYIACDSCPRNFHLGEQAEIYITTGALDRALMVPETAIENFSGTTGMVWTIEGGELRRRKVGLGHRTLDSRLEITGGVPDGAFVVRTLRPGLREGRAAKVLE